MKIIHTIIIAAVLVVAGCVTATRINSVSVGMTKQEVVSAMGAPTSTAAPGGGVEILRYELREIYGLAHEPKEYYVKLINGKVDSYGRMGDFDSTKDPTFNYNIKNR
jgi:SmpA / OmlA family